LSASRAVIFIFYWSFNARYYKLGIIVISVVKHVW